MEKISIIIPCYNEENNIRECVWQIPKMPCQSEIIIVDDGSTDQTAKHAHEIRKSNLKVVRYEKNLGKGAAVKAGFQHTTGDIIVILDADYTSPPSEILVIIKPILDGEADFVIGNRFLYPMEKNAMNIINQLSNRASAFVISLYIGQRITDSLCGLKAFKRELINRELKENGWPDFELLIAAKRMNMRITEMPIHYKARKSGVSKMNTFRKFYQMPILLIKSLI